MTHTNVKVTVAIPTFNRAELLRDSMASVLSQSYREFRLLVCDNASKDDTAETVASFADSRIDYVPSRENIGMIANFNRAIKLAETEFLLLLPDDDILYPDYLRRTVEAFERYPNAGVVHTAFDLIDGSSDVVERARTLIRIEKPVVIEAGNEYLERSMRSPWTVCWPSALFRTRALADAGGLRENDEPLADFPLLMRIACNWDLAYLSTSLVAFRLHADAATAALGAYTGVGYDLRDEQPEVLYNQRRRFLDEANLSEKRTRRYRSLAELTLRQDKVRLLAVRGGSDAPWMSTTKAMSRLVRTDPRVLLLPATWRLLGAQLGGRLAKRVVLRLGR